MSAPESPSRESPASVTLSRCLTDVTEIAPLRGRAGEVRAHCAARGCALPQMGHLARGAHGIALCVRPERWLLLSRPAPPGAAALAWQGACGALAAVLDHSAAFAALYLSGAGTRSVLARGSRIDLEPPAFACGRAATTPIAQVSVTLAALAAGVLLLTPASTARHLREWLLASGRPFGLAAADGVSVDLFSDLLSGDTVA